MNKERAIYFAGLMEEYLNIPSCVCENIENELINGEYYKVINYVIERRKELENKANYKTYQEIADIISQLQQENKILRENAEHNDKVVDKVNWENKKLKEHIEKYERYCKTTGIEELMKEKKLQQRINIAIEYIKYNATSNYFDKEKNMFRREEDLLKILKGVE